MTVLPARTPDLEKLRDFSVRIGTDATLVQASSGNTSIKLGGELWIKASGRWLARAAETESFVPLDLDRVRRSVRRGEELTAEAGTPHRPSIETAMHGVLPQPVVAHVHSVNTLAWAVREDGARQLAERLAGLSWEWIPYVPSGLALAQAIFRACGRSPRADTFVLANHGLVVCGETCEAVEELLRDVETRVATRERPAPAWDPTLAYDASYLDDATLPDDATLHSLATDPVSLRILEAGILYPCQAMFLGAGPSGLPHWEEGAAFRIAPGRGVIVRRSMTRTQRAVLGGLRHVVQRLDSHARIRYLTCSQIRDLFAADAHGYCQSAEAGASTTA